MADKCLHLDHVMSEEGRVNMGYGYTELVTCFHCGIEGIKTAVVQDGKEYGDTIVWSDGQIRTVNYNDG